MSDYRIYCLDGGGRIDFAEWIDAADDAEAISKAREMKNGAAKCEIWEQHRLVATLNAEDLKGRPGNGLVGDSCVRFGSKAEGEP